jgi:pimeloyl-ACP methyl ester carboxylesterase
MSCRLLVFAPLFSCTSSAECTDQVLADLDGDGFGDDTTAQTGCPGPGKVSVGGDCDDANPGAFPGATPVCDAVSTDDDCDGVTDPEDLDADADGSAICAGDCDDTTGAVSPLAPEMCNTVDDDCDGRIDIDDDDLVDAIRCGQCPDVADIGLAPMFIATYNPCLLDPATVAMCHRDDPDYVQTHTRGDRLHRVAYRTDQPLRDDLVLFLPPGPGEDNSELLTYMAHAGHRVISLGWPNRNSAFVPEDTFFENVRGEVAYGEDLSPYVDVGPVDSIVARLTTLLDFLAQDQPSMGWDAYRNVAGVGADAIAWDRIIIAGWSEGGGEAGWLAREHLFAGVVLISAPTDVGGPIEGEDRLPPASWVYDPRVTPACRHFVFFHAGELLPDPTEDAFLLSWDAMGILPFGETGVDVDMASPPYADSHVLHTDLIEESDVFCAPHTAMAVDDCLHPDLAVPYLWLFCTAGVSTDACP